MKVTNTTVEADSQTRLNSLLQGELAAVESYERSLDKFEQYPAAVAELRRIRDEHRESVRALRECIAMAGGTPVESSGSWGTFASVVTRAAKLIGPDTTLADLQHGEEHGITDYHDAMTSGLPSECESLIADSLLARCRAHVSSLERVRVFLK